MLCARYPQDENTGMVAAGASEQQEQHELKEESGFAGRWRDKEGWERKRDLRAEEERIEEEILVGVLAM